MPSLLRPPPPKTQKKKSWNAYNFAVEKGKCRGTDCKCFSLHSMRVAASMIPTAIVHRQGSGHPWINDHWINDMNILTFLCCEALWLYSLSVCNGVLWNDSCHLVISWTLHTIHWLLVNKTIALVFQLKSSESVKSCSFYLQLGKLCKCAVYFPLRQTDLRINVFKLIA